MADLPLFSDVSSSRENYKKFKAFVEYSGDACLLLNATYGIEYVNPAVTTLFGYSPNLLVGQSSLSYIHAEDLSAVRQAISHVVLKDADDLSWIEFRVRHARGSWCWVRGSYFNLLHDPDVHSIVAILRDVTEQKGTQQILQSSEERYRSFIAQSTEGIWRFELDKPLPINIPYDQQIEWIYQYAYLAECNDAMARMYGYKSHTELEGARLRDLFVDSDPTNTEYLRSFIENEYRLTNALSHERDRDGQDRYFQNNLIGVLENGFVLRAWGTQRDVTNQMIAEREIHESKHELQEIIDGTPHLIYLKDLDGRYIMINREYELQMRVNRQSIIGSTVQDIFGSQVSNQTQEYERRALTSQTPITYETKIPFPDGERIFQVTKFVIRNIDGLPYALCGVANDITKRKKTEQLKDDFLSMASHELKTPLTSVLIFTQILRGQLLKIGDDSALQSLSKIDRQLNRLTSLVHNLLDISRIQVGKIAFNYKEVDIVSTVRDAVSVFQQTTMQHTIRYEPRDASCFVEVDDERIGQVLSNLLSNAIKYSPNADQILVKEESTAHDVSIFVQDFGIGISTEHLQRVFDRFYRVQEVGEYAFPGLGIGLFISSEIVKRHGGQLTVSSEVGKGSTFRLTLPKKQISEVTS